MVCGQSLVLIWVCQPTQVYLYVLFVSSIAASIMHQSGVCPYFPSCIYLNRFTGSGTQCSHCTFWSINIRANTLNIIIIILIIMIIIIIICTVICSGQCLPSSRITMTAFHLSSSTEQLTAAAAAAATCSLTDSIN